MLTKVSEENVIAGLVPAIQGQIVRERIGSLIMLQKLCNIDSPKSLLWITGILAALAPAWRATQVAPEIATRTV